MDLTPLKNNIMGLKSFLKLENIFENTPNFFIDKNYSLSTYSYKANYEMENVESKPYNKKIKELTFEPETIQISRHSLFYFDYALVAMGVSSLSVGEDLYYGEASETLFKHNLFDDVVRVDYGEVEQEIQFYTMIGMSAKELRTAIYEEDKTSRYMTAIGLNYKLEENHRLNFEFIGTEGSFKNKEDSNYTKNVLETRLSYRYFFGNVVFETGVIEDYMDVDFEDDRRFITEIKARF